MKAVDIIFTVSVPDAVAPSVVGEALFNTLRQSARGREWDVEDWKVVE
jgi:hypothetical protein